VATVGQEGWREVREIPLGEACHRLETRSIFTNAPDAGPICEQEHTLLIP
jgi:hypothetical protein